MPLLPGTILGERYVIDGVLGRGGFATVYAARHAQLASEHAIKVLHAGADEAARARLLSEGRIQARLNHPNVVRVTDVVELPYGVGLVMDTIHGETLRARLDRGRVPLGEAQALGEGLIRGVAAAHALGLVHRDLKPENVLVDRDGVPKVIDFGIARGEDQSGQTQSGVGMGTPGYMAPEAYHDVATAGPPADVFGLGVILYELLSGQRPFSERAPWMRQLEEARQAAWTPLSALSPGLPQTLIDAVHAALSPHAADRPPDAGRLLACWLGQAAPAPVQDATTITLELGASVVALPEPGLASRHNLPAERDPFIGREHDLAALTSHLSGGARALTLLGIGGLGKTRLALHYAHQQLRAWPGGVWFCDLADAHDLDGVVRAVAAALGVPLGRFPVAQLGHAIAGRGRCLVILDNFEQVTAVAQETVGRWLDAAPEARLLVTSRERLGLPGETVLVLTPLEEDAAVALFTARSMAVGGQIGPDDIPTLRALVRLLDQLPLAIELAAARSRMMRPESMLSRMKDRFRLLSAPNGRPDRHATLRAMLDWSWELLSQDEQQALAQLAVFVGGFTLEAAEAVLDVGEAWPADLVQSLVDKSLVRAVPLDREDTLRFELLVSVTEYAAARLDELGGRAEAEARHGAFFASSGQDAAIESLHRHGGFRLRRLLGREVDNLLAATHRAVARGDGVVAAGCVRAVWDVLQFRGPLTGGVPVSAEVLNLPTLSSRARAITLRVHADALRVMGRFDEAMVHAEAARALFGQLGERGPESAMLGMTGALLHAQGRLAEAEERFKTALSMARAVGALRVEGGMLCHLASLYGQQGRFDEARALLDEDLLFARRQGDRRSEGVALGNRAIHLVWRGEHGQALEHLEQALAIARESDDRGSEALCLANLGMLHQELNQHAAARPPLEAALIIARDIGARHLEGVTLGALAAALSSEGHLDEAHERAIGGEQILRALGDKMELAKLLCVRVLLHHQRQDPAAAAATLAEAEALAAALSVTPESELGQAISRARAVVH
jgi:predicted ATPase